MVLSRSVCAGLRLRGERGRPMSSSSTDSSEQEGPGPFFMFIKRKEDAGVLVMVMASRRTLTERSMILSYYERARARAH
jgi:hypothetical protein